MVAGNGFGKKSSWTEMALIGNEVSRKATFYPGQRPDAPCGQGFIRAETMLDDVTLGSRTIFALTSLDF